MFKKSKQSNLILGATILFIFSLSLVFVFRNSLFTKNVIFIPENDKAVLFSPEQTKFSLPIRLKIPQINIDANVEYVGITPDGAMDVPKGPADVAWYKFGSRPGEIGSAVLAGHYGWKDNIPAVFDDLHKLQKGDKIYVEDEKGIVITFVVRESRIYDQNANTKDIFDSSDGKSHLNLITCEGAWNEKEKGRPNRLIVFADKE